MWMNPGLSSSKLCPSLLAPLCRQCCSLHVSTSLVSLALVTDAPTHCVAQVSQCLESVKLHHRMSILRLYVVLVKHWQRSTLRRRPCQASCERKEDGITWSWNPWRLRGGMTERGTTSVGEPQINGVPRVHRTLDLDGCGTMGGNIRLGYNGICPLTSLATIHGSPVTNGAKLSHHGTKSRLGGRLAHWTLAKARPPTSSSRCVTCNWSTNARRRQHACSAGMSSCLPQQQVCALWQGAFLSRPHTAGELRLTLQDGPVVARSPLVYERAPHIQRVHTKKSAGDACALYPSPLCHEVSAPEQLTVCVELSCAPAVNVQLTSPQRSPLQCSATVTQIATVMVRPR